MVYPHWYVPLIPPQLLLQRKGRITMPVSGTGWLLGSRRGEPQAIHRQRAPGAGAASMIKGFVPTSRCHARHLPEFTSYRVNEWFVSWVPSKFSPHGKQAFLPH